MPPALPTLLELARVWWQWLDWGSFALAVVSVPSVLVQRRGRPTAAVSWILVLLTAPLLGLLLWWLFGRRYLERRKRRKRRSRDALQRRLSTLRAGLGAPPNHGPTLLPVRHIPDTLASSVFPPTSHNEVELIDSKAAFARMEADIRAAKHHVHALFYIWQNDETGRSFRRALMEKAREGVQVRVLCDAVGSPVMATRFAWPLRKAGAQVARFLPPQWFSRSPRVNFRNHRKILVVDGRVGVIGGFNIGDEYRKEWRDVGVRIAGPAVDQLQEIFADDWYYATDEDLAAAHYFGCWTASADGEGAACAAVASGPDSWLSPIHDALFMAINEAERRIYLTTPYFIPTAAILAALRAAVFRGVDVRIMVPAKSDVMLVRHAARAYYPELLQVGVRIFEYRPAMLHAKVAVLDDALVMIGSANLDNRSFRLNFEASCFVGSRDINRRAAERFASDLLVSREVTLKQLRVLPWTTKLLSATAHLLSPLL